MNIGGYGQNLARLGLNGMAKQGARESQRELLRAEQERDEEAATGQAAGLLTGASTRAAQGIYDDRKAAFEKKADKAGSNSSEALTKNVSKPEYSALDDLQHFFKDWWD
jgi:hypothetical protein